MDIDEFLRTAFLEARPMFRISPVGRNSRRQNSRSKRSGFRFQSDWLLAGKFVQLEPRNLAAPVFVLNTPNLGIGATAWAAGDTIQDPFTVDNDADTSNGSMSTTVTAVCNSADWFGDGTGQQLMEQNLSTNQITALSSPTGTPGISLSASQINQLSAQSPGMLDDDIIAGAPPVGSTVGTSAAGFGNGQSAVTWAFGNSSDPSTPYTGSVTLSGEFQLHYSATWSGWSNVGFAFAFQSDATGISVNSFGTDQLAVSYPSGGTVINAIIDPVRSVTFNADGSVNGGESLDVDFDYSIVDTDPAAGEAIFYTSTINAQATALGAGPPAEDVNTWANAQNGLTYSFSENAS
jgi:hypothetical protein